MKQFILLFLFFLGLTIQAKPKVKVYYKQVENGYQLFVANDEFCEVSVVLRLNLDNLKASTRRQRIFVIPAKKGHFKLMDLVAVRQGGYSFSFKFNVYRGNISKATYDMNFPYYLPFKKGQSFNIGQGYDGAFTHQNKKALDFTMPIGTPITAIRRGKVILVVDSFSKHGETADFSRYANYILIEHSDGTFASYVHLKQNSSKVKEGDLVKIGQEMALSGNTGWTSGPHLHLEVYIPKAKKNQTIVTRFKVANGNAIEVLKEKQTYKRDY
jgi:murein DD-endopeptidase MepM/ murein hydrolase activator NlpD